MNIIENNAERLLQKRLSYARMEGETLRCLHMKPATADMPTQALINLLNLNHDCSGITLYVCTDHDLFAVGDYLPAKLITVIGEAANAHEFTPPSIELFELPVHWVPLIELVEAKIQHLELEEERARALAEKLRQEKERSAILDAEIEPLLLQTLQDRRRRHQRIEVLVIEDEDFTRSLVEAALQRDYNVTPVRQGAHALTTYAIKAPHVVFLDINLPDVSGHDLLKKIIAMDPAAYVVMLSGSGDRTNVLKSVESGARGFVGKPFNREKLTQYIHKCPNLPAGGRAPQKEKTT